MDLSLFKEYFSTCLQAETQIVASHQKFAKIPSFSLYKRIATKSQPLLTSSLLYQFLMTFNWQYKFNNFTLQSKVNNNYKVHSPLPQPNPEQLLDFGLQLLIKKYGNGQGINFDEFSKLIKGHEQIPNLKEISFNNKKDLSQFLINQIINLIEIEKLGKNIYHHFKNLSDLFETITATNVIDQQNIQRLFLTFSEKKDKKQMKMIADRANLPWNFDYFINLFKNNSRKNEFKIHYSSQRNKKQQDYEDKSFTTPRRQKSIVNHSSTKQTRKAEDKQFTFTTPSRFQNIQAKASTNYILILAQILQTQQKFNQLSSKLIKRPDFDLELVYERHGQKFQQILNTQYGVCNYSAFVRFIVPKDYEHRYLSFIRYQPDDILSKETNEQIDQFINAYHQKQHKIRQFWNQCDKQMLIQSFCMPKEQSLGASKLKEYFSTRQTNILLERFDPHRLGNVTPEALR